MKSKQIKILRKKLEKANKTGCNLPEGATLTGNDEKENQSDWNNDKISLTLQSWGPNDLKTNKRLPDFLKLFEDNMGEQYRQSSWGLNMEEKQTELSHAKARFLVLLDSKAGKENNDLAGFCHYRFDYDDEESPTEVVVYVYELQIRENYRRLGLGKRIMTIVEDLAKAAGLPKVMLTVFQSNQAALHFYQGIQYGIDETSPSQHGVTADYEVLSRSTV